MWNVYCECITAMSAVIIYCVAELFIVQHNISVQKEHIPLRTYDL